MDILCQSNAQDTYEKLKNKITELNNSTSESYLQNIIFNDSELSAIAKGTGYEAIFKFKDQKIEVDLKLGLLLKPLRSQIESKISEKITKSLS